MARVKWREWDGLGLDDDAGHPSKIVYTPAHTDDTSELATVIQQTGWTDRRGAIAASHILNLRTGWYGYVSGEYAPHACDEDGVSLYDDNESVEIVMPFTWVLVT